MMLYIKLFIEFMKIGLFSIGGGLATLPFLQELMEKTAWFTERDLSNLIAASECTPGPLGVNMSTYVGNLTGSLPGGIVSTLGLITPSVIVIIIVANFLQKFKESKTVQRIFSGLRPASTALIAVALCTVAKNALINAEVLNGSFAIENLLNYKGVALACLLWMFMKKFKVHPIIPIMIAAVVGIIFKF